MAVDYPNEFPLSEIKNVIQAVRSGSIKDNFGDFAHDAWVIQGYAQRMLLGGNVGPLSTQTTQDLEDIAVKELDLAVQAAENGELSSQQAIPWQLILSWILQILMKNLV